MSSRTRSSRDNATHRALMAIAVEKTTRRMRTLSCRIPATAMPRTVIAIEVPSEVGLQGASPPDVAGRAMKAAAVLVAVAVGDRDRRETPFLQGADERLFLL